MKEDTLAASEQTSKALNIKKLGTMGKVLKYQNQMEMYLLLQLIWEAS